MQAQLRDAPASRLDAIDWGAPLLPEAPSAEVAERAMRALGGVPAPLAYTAECGWLTDAMIAFARRCTAHLPYDLIELIGLVVSQDNSCRYCYGAQVAMLRMLGYRRSRIEKLEQDMHDAAFSPREKAAFDFARRFSRANPRPARPEREALARQGFSEPAIAEIAYTAAVVCFYNRVATLLSVPIAVEWERSVESLKMRLLSPLLALRMRRSVRGNAPAPAPEVTGPYAALVRALDGSPAAAVLRGVVEAAFSSPDLPPRARALAIGAIGRGLGCPMAVPQVKAWVEPLGLSGEDVDEILAHLASPKLDAFEARLLPFARETVRYKTGPLQRRTREFAEGLPRVQVLEAIGVTALANSLCRLSILLS